VAAAQWLSLRLQLLAAAVVVLVAGLGVAGAAGLLPPIASQAQRCILEPWSHWLAESTRFARLRACAGAQAAQEDPLAGGVVLLLLKLLTGS
jgi:hypothetical protein